MTEQSFEPIESRLRNTDVANATRFAVQMRDAAKFDPKTETWFVWDGRRWERQGGNAKMLRLAKQVALSIDREVAEETDDAQRDALRRWAKDSQGETRLKAMISIARTERSLWVDESEFDQSPYLVNFLNGVFDITTGDFTPAHDPANLMTKLIPHNYVPGAQCPTFLSVLSRSTLAYGNDTAEFLLRSLGYSAMVNGNPEQVAFFFKGDPNTGKSKLAELVAEVVGNDLGKKTNTALVARVKYGAHHDSELFSIRGKQFVFLDETDDKLVLDEQRFKAITGGAGTEMRQLYKGETQNVRTSWTIFVTTNEMPDIGSWDGAIARRIVVIPSGPTIPAHEVNQELDNDIRAEAEGVLAKLIGGARMWYVMRRDGVGSGFTDRPAAVRDATQEVAEANDHVAAFVSAHVEFEAGVKTLASQVWASYCGFVGTRTGNPLAIHDPGITNQAFYKRLLTECNSRGHAVRKDARSFIHLRIVSERQSEDGPVVVVPAEQIPDYPF